MERDAEYLAGYHPEICSVEHCLNVAYAQGHIRCGAIWYLFTAIWFPPGGSVRWTCL